MEALGNDVVAAAALAARIRSLGMRAGVALKPGTPEEIVFPLLDASPSAVDMVLCLTVEPGFGGQSFMHSVLPKVTALNPIPYTLNAEPYTLNPTP
jgi:ribulose-phosphate 3-epimerase